MNTIERVGKIMLMKSQAVEMRQKIAALKLELSNLEWDLKVLKNDIAFEERCAKMDQEYDSWVQEVNSRYEERSAQMRAEAEAWKKEMLKNF